MPTSRVRVKRHRCPACKRRWASVRFAGDARPFLPEGAPCAACVGATPEFLAKYIEGNWVQ